MSPFCGGTRAARLTASGEFRAAWEYNPLGIIAVAGASIATIRALVGLTTRHWLTVSLSLSSPARRLLLLAIVCSMVLLQIRQQGRADLLLD
ncbi:DUF2752 domain-containing protein [Nocardioides sp. T2.26MG-1]|uniref:DUF2752 domain-containing protein n=1 Tax=Nocardioides sp. T2.26MG-1 TaxID=3041166 RepID=UPI00406CD3EC